MAPTAKTSNAGKPAGTAAAIRRLAPLLLLGLSAAACGRIDSGLRSAFGDLKGPGPGQAGYVTGFVGEVVADEPRAALAGREVLSAGGSAADAAAAVALSLSVTLPSRAGLGAGGVCLAYSPDPRGLARGRPEAVMFESTPARSIGGGDRPAAVPALARGVFLLHARYGRLPFELAMSKAEQFARFGVPVSRALARDLAVVAQPLLADPGSRATFGTGGTVLSEGQALVQPYLAATLAQLRVSGVGSLYQGTLARQVEDASVSAGVPIGLADLRTTVPSLATPVVIPYKDDLVAFPPSAGGVGTAAAFKSVVDQPPDLRPAWNRALAVAERWRAGGVTADQLLNATLPEPAAVPLYPASTTFVTMDPDGDVVVCGLTLNNLFGTGRMLPGLGFLAAASPGSVTPPLLSMGLAWNGYASAFHAAAGGSGQVGAPLAAATALYGALRSGVPMPALTPDPGRANAIVCSRYLPGAQSSCAAATDPREAGLATSGQ